MTDRDNETSTILWASTDTPQRQVGAIDFALIKFVETAIGDLATFMDDILLVVAPSMDIFLDLFAGLVTSTLLAPPPPPRPSSPPFSES
jgi:hypothetical protein